MRITERKYLDTYKKSIGNEISPVKPEPFSTFRYRISSMLIRNDVGS